MVIFSLASRVSAVVLTSAYFLCGGPTRYPALYVGSIGSSAPILRYFVFPVDMAMAGTGLIS